jgi:hypothetical protein
MHNPEGKNNLKPLSPTPIQKPSSNFRKPAVLVLAAVFLGCVIVVLFPQVRRLMLEIAENLFLHRKSERPLFWMDRFFKFAALLSVFTAGGLLLFTPAGKKLFNKTEENNRLPFSGQINPAVRKHMLHSESLFMTFAVLSSLFVFIVALSRAAGTGITWDEAVTYKRYVLPNIVDSFTKSQMLNNHFLNSLAIRFMDAVSGTRYNELIIRFPNLIFYCIYFVFAFAIAKPTKRPCFVFALFILNYYLNEFFGLARGYGMACACMTGVCYFFEKWKIYRNNKKEEDKYFHLFLIFCSLAALANTITLYITFSFLIIINFKYKKDVLTLPNLYAYFIFIITGLHSIENSRRGGEGVYSTNGFFTGIIGSIPRMFSGSQTLIIVISVLFLLTAAFLAVKTKLKNDYVLIFAVFCLVCVLSQVVFRRGYPLMQEIIPLYSVCVFIIVNALDFVPDLKVMRPVSALCIGILFYQFAVKINTKTTADWYDNYRIRDEIFSYAASHNITAEDGRGEYLRFLEDCKSKFVGNPAVDFYEQKIAFLLKNNSGE